MTKLIKNVVNLNLPKPSEYLINLVLKSLDTAPIVYESKQQLDALHSNSINSALQCFYVAPEDVCQQTIKEFQSFFPNHKIKATVGMMKTINDLPAVLPPHIDRARTLGINYYISLGGDQVKTIFYNFSRPVSFERSYQVLYSDTNGIKNIEQFSQDWYAFDGNYCHSVENITDTRLFLGIAIVNNNLSNSSSRYQLTDLINEFPELIRD